MHFRQPFDTDAQAKTFGRWANIVLGNRKLRLINVLDLADGVKILSMLDVLSGERIPCFENPRNYEERLVNISKVLKTFSSLGVDLGEINAVHIANGYMHSILTFMWCLIKQYHISRNDDSAMDIRLPLLKWVNERIALYGKRVSNFGRDWIDGTALLALVDSMREMPSAGIMARLKRTRDKPSLHEIRKAVHDAAHEFAVPPLVDSRDMGRDLCGWRFC